MVEVVITGYSEIRLIETDKLFRVRTFTLSKERNDEFIDFLCESYGSYYSLSCVNSSEW